jgi:hypothetical protein
MNTRFLNYGPAASRRLDPVGKRRRSFTLLPAAFCLKKKLPARFILICCAVRYVRTAHSWDGRPLSRS